MSKSGSKKSNKKKGNAKKTRQTATRNPVRLSQCMIVRNEEKNIERALSWGRGIVCEQIVVDTGSTDRTVEIAEKMGAKVFHFQWIDDFSAAKNFAIEQASGNWIAFLDADEYFQQEDAEKLMGILERADRELHADVITTRMAHVNGDGKVTGTGPQQRLFRNGRVKYRYRIHESLCGVDGTDFRDCDAQDQLLIVHTGYAQGEMDAEKGLRNIKLLKKDLEDSPNDGMKLMYLADAYVVAGMEQEALEVYRRILWNPAVDNTNADFHSVARAGFQIMNMRRNDPPSEIEEEYRRIYDRVYEVGWGDHPDADYHMGLWYALSGRLGEAAEFFEVALEKMNAYKGTEIARILSNIQVPYWVTAATALYKGDLQKAVSRAVECLRVDKYNGDGIHILIKAFQFEYQSMNAGDGGGAEPPGAGDAGSAAPYRDFLFRLYDAGNLKDVVFLHKFAKDAGFDALDQVICEVLPPEVRNL